MPIEAFSAKNSNSYPLSMEMMPEEVYVSIFSYCIEKFGDLRLVSRTIYRISTAALDPHGKKRSKMLIGASLSNNIECVKNLLSDTRVFSAVDHFAIQLASQKGHLEVIRELLKDKRIDPSAKKNYAIWLASENGHWKVVQELLKDSRVDPSAQENNAIGTASENGHWEVVRELLKHNRVDPSAKENYAICRASRNGHWEVVQELLKDNRVNPAAKGNYSIFSAIMNGQWKVVRELLKDSRIDRSGVDDALMLIRASKRRSFSKVKELMTEISVKNELS